MQFLQHLLDVLPKADAPILGTIAAIIEFALRLFPSAAPLSILHVIGGAIKLIGSIFSRLGDLLDAVLPQRLKD